MGIELNQYRAAIGNYHGSLKNPATTYCGGGDVPTKPWVTVLLINCLLAICMDVHPHPGPVAQTPNPVSTGPITLCHLNVRSINVDGRLGEVINQLANTHDVITMGETWLSESDEDQVYAIHGYTGPYRMDRNAQRGGGVLAWVKNSIVVKE